MDTSFFRNQLNQKFDDVQLDAFCLDYFVEVYERFSRGMRRDEKINLLLDYCRREEGRERRLGELLGVSFFGEDGQSLAADAPVAPLEAFDTSAFLASLQVPGGAVHLRDELYVRRKADERLARALVQWGTTTTIRASRQTGKTSLLMRGLHQVQKGGVKVVCVDLQAFSDEQRAEPAVFYYELATMICRQLRLDEGKVERAWQRSRHAQQKMTYFLEDEVLPLFDVPVVLALDEADSLLHTAFAKDFFGLVRSWHNLRASPLYFELWEKLNLVLVISTEPYLLIKDINQSPFNVGLRLELEDFTSQQVQWLNQKHGEPVRGKAQAELMSLLGGHPYLTRQALYTLVVEGISWQQLVEQASSEKGPFSQHLLRYQWALHQQPELREALREVSRFNACRDQMARLRLLKAGLIRVEGERCTFRCGLYKRYFEEKLR